MNTNPSNAGSIKCNNEEVILNSNLNNLFLGSKCIAKSNSGFHFSSWIEDLGNNASRTINSSSTSSNNILEFFFDRLGLNSALLHNSFKQSIFILFYLSDSYALKQVVQRCF